MFVASREEGEEKEKGTPVENEGVLADTSHLLQRDDWSSSVKMQEGDWSSLAKSISHWLNWKFSLQMYRHLTSKMCVWS